MPTGAVATFDVPASGAISFLSAPFPNEVFRAEDGTLDLADVPVRGVIGDSILEVLNERRGFCRTCPIHFPIEGSLDASTVPGDATGAASASDAIVLMRQDAVGGFVPLMVDSPDGSLRILPAAERILEPNTSYIAALTDAIQASDGTPLAPSEGFRAIRDGEDTSSRAASSLNAALDALETAGVQRQHVVSVAAFTTVDTGAILRDLAALVDGAPTSSATVDRIYRRSDGTLDELLGTPAMAGAGLLPAATAGETAVAHDNVEMVILGSFPAPRLPTGTGTASGVLLRAADGSITPTSTLRVPFAMSIPVGADLTNLPIALTEAGIHWNRGFAVLMANTLNGIGVATIAIDPYLSGARAESASDDTNSFRGTTGGDGFDEVVSVDVVASQQGLTRTGDAPLGDPKFLEAASYQWISDLAQTIRLLQEGDVSGIAAADASLAGLAFDSSRLFFVGLSHGSFTGLPALVVRPGISAAVFNAGYGTSLAYSAQSPGGRSTFDALAPTLVGVRERFDGVTLRMRLSPSITLPFDIFDELTPGPTVHYLLDEPLTDATPPHVLFQQAEFDESVGQVASEQLPLAAGVPTGGGGAYHAVDLSIEAGPFTANRVTPNGTVTAAAWMYVGATHQMIFDRSGELKFESPYRYPFTSRPTPETVNNPTDDVHAQLASFFQSLLDGGDVTIVTP